MDEDEEDSQGHYWDYVTTQFPLESVKFINFYYLDATSAREKALGWLLLSLSCEKADLSHVLLEVFNCIPVLERYRRDDSYLWQNRKEVLECAKAIEKLDLYSPCPLIERYIQYRKKRDPLPETDQEVR